MSVTPVEPVVTPAEPPVATATPPVPTPPAPPAAPAASNVWDDPKAAQAEIEKLRRENGAERVTAKAQAADAAKKEMAQTIAKALGLDSGDETDPAKLTASLTTAQSEAKQARVELAVFRNASTAGADPAALLDSSSFLKSLEGIDANDATAVSVAIAAAVAANPRLGAAPAGPQTPQPPAPNPAQGAAGNGTAGVAQLAQSDMDRMSPEQIADAEAKGQFDRILGRT